MELSLNSRKPNIETQISVEKGHSAQPGADYYTILSYARPAVNSFLGFRVFCQVDDDPHRQQISSQPQILK